MKKKWIISLITLAVLLLVYLFVPKNNNENIDDIPLPVPQMPTDHAAYTTLNGNMPEFTEADLDTDAYEYYSELDDLGRCGYAMACVGVELMPTEDRGSIGQVKPSGWHTVKYDFVDGKYLYNRCHLLGYQLTGENANNKNLITGTRYMNVDGMLPFENMIADYVKETENHVLFRVTPVFDDDNLVAKGVQMEAMSIEDEGEGICFNVFVHNIQPGVTIDYYTGISCETEKLVTKNPKSYILDKKDKLFHNEDCSEEQNIDNPREYTGGREELFNHGYKACKKCKP